MFLCEGLIFKLHAIDTLSAGAVASSEVTALSHESLVIKIDSEGTRNAYGFVDENMGFELCDVIVDWICDVCLELHNFGMVSHNVAYSPSPFH